MNPKDTSGQAFPSTPVTIQSQPQSGIGMGIHPWDQFTYQPTAQPGMTKREYLAAHCPAEEVASRLPHRYEDTLDALIARKMVPAERRELATPEYSTSELARLRAAVRYEYADDMLKAAELDGPQ